MKNKNTKEKLEIQKRFKCFECQKPAVCFVNQKPYCQIHYPQQSDKNKFRFYGKTNRSKMIKFKNKSKRR